MMVRTSRSITRVQHGRAALAGLLALGVALAAMPASAGDAIDPEPTLQLVRPARAPLAPSAFQAANSSCVGAQCDTVWVGHLSSGPGGPFMGVGVGGVWDFDTDVAGTDSSQGWQRYAYPYTSGTSLAATDRPAWAYDYGNMINEGNTNLWHARDLAGRQYVRHGCVGRLARRRHGRREEKIERRDGAELDAHRRRALRVVWATRLRGPARHRRAHRPRHQRRSHPQLRDAVVVEPRFPRLLQPVGPDDVQGLPSSGTGTVALRARTDLNSFIDNAIAPQVTGWFNPDPTKIANFVGNPSDSFMVYVGSPNEAAYDTNRRWFSEVLDFARPVKELFAYGKKMPVSARADTSLALAYSGIQPVGGNIRVVFRVKTNRVRADQVVGSTGIGNTKDGAAV